MSEKKQFISPISVDLGAKNTGVYFAHYEAGSALDEIQNKKGKVYQLEKDKYTLLMQNRTANRHQKRGFDRRQMVKRLFKLIWTKHFKLEWNKDIQQTISFLLNRRGFTFLTEEYDPEVLKEFPSEIINHKDFPRELRRKLAPDSDLSSESVNLQEKIEELSKNSNDLKTVIKLLEEKNKEITKPLYVIAQIKKLKEYCQNREKKSKGKNLSELPHWVLEEWEKRGIKKLNITNTKQKSFDVVSHLNELSPEEIKAISESIPETKQEKEKCENSIWNIQIKKFNLEKSILELEKSPEEIKEKNDKNKLKWMGTHLQHLGFALDKTYNEIKSGGRHRSKYFEEVKEVLEYKYNDNSPKYLKKFCDNLEAGNYAQLDKEKLKNLIGHLSNFELNLLRSYFNYRSHKKEDQWDEDKLNKKFKHWIKNIWRVNPEKDKDKADNKEYSYKKLREKLKNNENIIDFFLKEDPNWTIPPYQDKDNRHPPKCQSLILNANYLDQHYKDWKSWLEELKKSASDYVEDYEEQLKSLKSGKNKSYFGQKIENNLKKDSGKRTEKHLKARSLQFILDRVKKNDPFKLNQVFSHTKKIKQNIRDNQNIAENKKKLQQTIEKSKLPQSLKSEPNFNKDNIFQEGSFLHLVYKYYKIKQRAKAGRLFIHPKYNYIKNRGYENTGRFEEKNHLLVYCNHKPRRKKHQTFEDLSSVLQVSSKKLREKVKDSYKETEMNLINILKNIKGLQLTCSKIAKQQKERRGSLKLHINTIYRSIYKAREESMKKTPPSIHNNSEKNIKINANSLKKQEEKLTENTLKQLTQTKRVKDAKDLYKLCEKSKKLYIKILKKLDLLSDNKEQDINKNLKSNPAIAFYLLAQINNIAFKERSGNATTCPVCSRDSSERMQMIPDKTNKLSAKASRLPAIPTRMIDGAIMRMTRIITKAITEEKWKDIEAHLEKNEKVSIPIVTESNQFEFEPSREELVRQQRNRVRKGKVLDRKEGYDFFEKELTEKVRRIKQQNTICPYTGENISSDNGERDHIIPRQSKYGTLNDEANLIWASQDGNSLKSNNEYSLSKLKTKYKQEVFNKESVTEIKNWIKKTIWDDEADSFKFGKYTSFINLNSDEQKAFKHALFLVGDPLRDKVIQAIDNRNRSFVNGTQRYFAEVLANELYKKAKKEKLDRLLNFDYFFTPFQEINQTRKDMEKIHPELEEYQKTKDKPQKSYSHLIDAQIAFISSLSKHYNEGSFKLKANFIDILEDYKKIEVSNQDFNNKQLKRRSTNQNFYKHRAMFRDTFYREIFLPIIITSNGELGFGFKSEDNCWKKLNRKDLDFLEIYIVPFLENKTLNQLSKIEKNLSISKISDYLKSQKKEYIKLFISTKKVHTFYIEKANTQKNQEDIKSETRKIIKFLKSISYKTESKEITESLMDNLYYLFKNKNLSSLSKNEFMTYQDDIKDKCKKFKKKDANKSLFKEEKAIQITDEQKKEIKSIFPIMEADYKETLKKIQLFSNDTKNQLDTKMFKKDTIVYPFLCEWKNLTLKYVEEKINDSEFKFDTFLKDYFLKRNNISQTDHNKKRCKFSLPVLTTEGVFLQKRKSWNGKTIYQIVNGSDPRKNHNKYQKPFLIKDGTIKENLVRIYKTKNLFTYKEYIIDSNAVELNQETFEEIKPQTNITNKYNKYNITKLFYKFTDCSRPVIKVYFDRKPTDIELFKLDLLKPRSNEKTKKEELVSKAFQDQNGHFIIEYKGDGSCLKNKLELQLLYKDIIERRKVKKTFSNF